MPEKSLQRHVAHTFYFKRQRCDRHNKDLVSIPFLLVAHLMLSILCSVSPVARSRFRLSSLTLTESFNPLSTGQLQVPAEAWQTSGAAGVFD